MIKVDKIIGAQRILDWFGSWPLFHDAEVIEVHLSRDEDSWVRLRTKGTDTAGSVVKPAVVSFYMTGVTDAQMHGFNASNSIVSLEIENVGDDAFKIIVTEAEGFGGSVTFEKLSMGLSTLV